MAKQIKTYHGFPVGKEITPTNRNSWQAEEVRSGRRRFFEPFPAAPNPWENEGQQDQPAKEVAPEPAEQPTQVRAHAPLGELVQLDEPAQVVELAQAS